MYYDISYIIICRKMIPARLYPRLGLLFSLGGAQVGVANNRLLTD